MQEWAFGASHAHLWLVLNLSSIISWLCGKCFDLRIKFSALGNISHQMTSGGKTAGPRTVKHGAVTECPHRNVLMNSYGSAVHSSLEVKTAKCSVGTEISGMRPLHPVAVVQKVGPQHVQNSP